MRLRRSFISLSNVKGAALLRQSLLDDAPADDLIPLVKDRALTRGDTLSHFIETYSYLASFRIEIAERPLVLIPDLGHRFHTRGYSIIFHPVDLPDKHLL